MDIFSTRELALILYFLLAFSYVIFNKKYRKIIYNFSRTIFNVKLITPFIIIICYSILLVYIFSSLQFWKWLYIKDVIIWVLFAGVPMSYNAISEKIDNSYFKNLLIDNIKFTAIISFFTSTFTFNILIELLMQPVLLLFIILQTVTNKKEENANINKIISLIVSIIGFIILFNTIKNALNSYQNIIAFDLLIIFSIPIIMSFIFIPIIYGIAVYAKYELLFIRMRNRIPNSKKIRLRYGLRIFRTCKLSYFRICKFITEYLFKLNKNMSESEFRIIIEDFNSSI